MLMSLYFNEYFADLPYLFRYMCVVPCFCGC